VPGAEQAHKKGMDGVYNAKRWLEATTRFEILYTVYDNPRRVTLKLLDGSERPSTCTGATSTSAARAPRRLLRS
jgi:hypothetical protein